MRRVIAALIVVGLAIGVVLLWPDSTADTPPPTVAGPTTTASTPTTAADTPTTTATDNTSSTSGEESHVVETVEEAEEILHAFLFTWFSSIYERDEEKLRSVIGNPRQVEAGLAQFGQMEFSSEPTPNGIIVNQIEILRADERCLAVWSESGADFRGGVSSIVHVFQWNEGSWLFINTWLHRDDLWEADCESEVQQ